MSATPAPVRMIFFTGHPMLMSSTSAPWSRAILAASAMFVGSAPNSCTTSTRSPSARAMRGTTVSGARSRASLETISVTAQAHPCSKQIVRKASVVTEASGASQGPG